MSHPDKVKSVVMTGPGKVELQEFPWPKHLEPGALIAKVEMAGICGTDKHAFDGDTTLYGGTESEQDMVYPHVPGHENSAIVVEMNGKGSDIEYMGKDLQIGDRVAMSWSLHSQYINLKRKNVYKLPDNVSFRDAALLHIGTFPLAAIRKCRLVIGEAAIVMGQGIRGLTAVKLLKAAGAVPVIAVDPVAEKREKALVHGADFAFDPTAPDFAAQVKAISGGGAKVGIEGTGIGAGLDGILDCMAPFGRVALLGCTRDKEFTIDYYRKVHGPGITLIGAHTAARPKEESHGGWWTQKDDVQALIKLHEFGRLRLGELVEEIHSPAEAPEVYNRLAREKSFPVVQFDWEALK